MNKIGVMILLVDMLVWLRGILYGFSFKWRVLRSYWLLRVGELDFFYDGYLNVNLILSCHILKIYKEY